MARFFLFFLLSHTDIFIDVKIARRDARKVKNFSDVRTL